VIFCHPSHRKTKEKKEECNECLRREDPVAKPGQSKSNVPYFPDCLGDKTKSWRSAHTLKTSPTANAEAGAMSKMS